MRCWIRTKIHSKNNFKIQKFVKYDEIYWSWNFEDVNIETLNFIIYKKIFLIN